MKDRSVGDILDEYLRALEAGNAPDRKALLARHPDVADELAAAFLGLDFVRGAAPSLSGDRAEPATSLGDYRLVREIGRGGMAVVYEAEQVSLGRRVALKVLPFAAVLDPKQLQRFKNEAVAAAHLQHPHIVPVHGVGCERGVHYYAMQYIEGQSLAAAIRDMRGGGAGEGPRTPISSHGSNKETAYIRMAAALGAQAAEALDHAHQLGIVHRDVKPGNLLVDQAGTLWITDFGLARSLNDVGLTVTGELLGTIRYMSPEQALAKRAPVDHRTDVYSLGATLYELFTLEPAFPGDDAHRVIQDIASKEPAPPRRLNPALPKDLETVLLKALSKDPAARYATALEMADDLGRCLADRPVLARRPSIAARTAKWSRRHRGLVGAALAVVLVGAVALVVGARREEHKTREALRTAETSLVRSRYAARRFLVEAGIADLQERPLPSPARRSLVEDALKFYSTDIEDRDSLMMRVSLLHALHRYEDAVAVVDRILRLLPDDVPALRQKGHMLWHLGRHDDALAVLDRAITMQPESAETHVTRGLVLESLRRLPDALEAHDRAIAADPRLVVAFVNRATVLGRLGRYAEALAASDRAVEIAPNALAYTNRGYALEALGRREEALAALDRAIATDTDCFRAHLNRGLVLMKDRRHAEALAAFDRALEIDPDFAEAHSNRGSAFLSLGRATEALAACDRALEIDPTAALAHANRGMALFRLTRYTEALAACDRALELDEPNAETHAGRAAVLAGMGRAAEALLACDRALVIDSRCVKALNNRGAALHALGRHQEALAMSLLLIEITPGDADAHRNHGLTLVALERPEDALKAFDRAIAINEGFAAAHMDRGVLLEKRGRREDALAAFDRVIAIDQGFAWAHLYRGFVLEREGKLGDARTAYSRAMDLGMRTPWLLSHIARVLVIEPEPSPANRSRALELAREAVKLDPSDGDGWNTLGLALCRAEASQGALDALAKAMEAKSGGDAHDWYLVAIAQWQLGRKEEARRWYEKAVSGRQGDPRDEVERDRLRQEVAALLGIG